MREILFRGQTRRKGEKVWMDGSPVDSNWVYGGIFQGPNYSVIYGYDPIEKHVVYSDTVGQFTGLTDKDGKKIFEGDVVKAERICNRETWMGSVVWWNGCFAIQGMKDRNVPAIDLFNVYEVIGNIHDNPELLEATP